MYNILAWVMKGVKLSSHQPCGCSALIWHQILGGNGLLFMQLLKDRSQIITGFKRMQTANNILGFYIWQCVLMMVVQLVTDQPKQAVYVAVYNTHCQWTVLLINVYLFIDSTVTEAPHVCADKLSDCKDYGLQACSGIYKPWAQDNCQKFCSLCTTSAPRKLNKFTYIDC